MATFINPFGGGTSGNLDIQQLAQQANIKAPEKKPLFSTLLDALNYPSKKTEEFLTGGSGYEQAGLPKPAAFGARLALDPLNLIGGLGIGSKVLKGAGVGAKLAGKVKQIGTAGRALGELFVPGYKLSKVSPQLARELPALETATRAKQAQSVRSVADLMKGFSPEVRKNIGKIIETGGKTSIEAQAGKKVSQYIAKHITQPELKAGVSPKLLADYFPRKVEREGIENLLKFGGRRLSLSLGGAEKQRKFLTLAEGEKAGVVYKEAAEALAIRVSKSEAARANSQFIQKLIHGEVKDIGGNPLVQTLTKGRVAPGYSEFTIKNLKGFQAPSEAVKDIEKYYKTFISDDATNSLLKFYDSALGVWKGSVTSLFPAFHIRNVVGNLTNMWLGGFKNPAWLAKAAAIQKGGTINVKGTTVTKDILEQLGIAGRGQFGADIPGVLGKRNLLQKLNPLEAGRRLGTTLEDNSRIAMFLDRLSKGDDVSKAVAQTHKYLFDYTALTPFEKNVMRRIVPFYTWMRNNIPLQLESLIAQPGKQALIAKTFRNLSPLTEEQQSNLPQYLQEGLTASLGKNEQGELKVLGSTGLPFEDLGRLYRGSVGRTLEREVIGSTGPLGNILGLITGKDFYRGKPTEELGYPYVTP